MEIERVEDWTGKSVTGPDGERIGRLEDIVFTGDGTPLYGAVSTGLFGRRTNLVPLSEATLSPDHVGVPYTKTQVKDAPQLGDASDMSSAAEDEAATHYGQPPRTRTADERYESATQRRQQAEAAQELEEQAREHEQRATELGAAAVQAQATAQAAQEQADVLAREHQTAVALAHETRIQQAQIAPATPPPS
jgi:sporulation protein YlmC with PRC-barrel domain